MHIRTRYVFLLRPSELCVRVVTTQCSARRCTCVLVRKISFEVKLKRTVPQASSFFTIFHFFFFFWVLILLARWRMQRWVFVFIFVFVVNENFKTGLKSAQQTRSWKTKKEQLSPETEGVKMLKQRLLACWVGCMLCCTFWAFNSWPKNKVWNVNISFIILLSSLLFLNFYNLSLF